MLFCFFIYSELFSYLIYPLSKRAEREDEICDYLCKDCKAGHGKCSLFVLKSPHREHTPFQAAQKEHCPHCNHATHLCRDHALFEVLYKSVLHCSIHRVTVGILYIVLPLGSIITI